MSNEEFFGAWGFDGFGRRLCDFRESFEALKVGKWYAASGFESEQLGGVGEGVVYVCLWISRGW